MIDLFRQLKLEYKDYLLLFKSGSFYIAFDEDATILHNLFNYKFVELKNNVKSGFPVNMLEGNLKVIDENKINYIIIENKRIIDKKIYKPNRFYKHISSVYDIINFSNRVDDIFKKVSSIEDKELKDKILDEIECILEKYGKIKWNKERKVKKIC